MARVLSFLIRYFSNYYTLHRSDLAARAAPLDPRLIQYLESRQQYAVCKGREDKSGWLQMSKLFYFGGGGTLL